MTEKRKYSIQFDQTSLTQQHSKDEVDINNIMKRYIKTGVIDHVAKYQPQYMDNDGRDYHESMNIIRKADEMFMELPATVRRTFNNNPHDFLNFVSDEKNHDKLAEMGLTNSPTPPTNTQNTQTASNNVVQTTETPSESAPAAQDTTASNSTTKGGDQAANSAIAK